MQIKAPSLSHGNFKLFKNNKDIFGLSGKMTVIYLGGGGDHIQLMVGIPEGLQIAPNVLVRKNVSDLIVDYVDGEEATKVILEDFFSASVLNPHHLKVTHPDKVDFSVTSHVKPVQSLDDGSSLIYFYGEQTVLAGLVENYLIDHHYEFDAYDNEKGEVKGDKVST